MYICLVSFDQETGSNQWLLSTSQQNDPDEGHSLLTAPVVGMIPVFGQTAARYYSTVPFVVHFPLLLYNICCACERVGEGAASSKPIIHPCVTGEHSASH